MRSCLLSDRGGRRERKRSGPSTWVLVWVTLYPGGLHGGDKRKGMKGKLSLPCLKIYRHKMSS